MKNQLEEKLFDLYQKMRRIFEDCPIPLSEVNNVQDMFFVLKHNIIGQHEKYYETLLQRINPCTDVLREFNEIIPESIESTRKHAEAYLALCRLESKIIKKGEKYDFCYELVDQAVFIENKIQEIKNILDIK